MKLFNFFLVFLAMATQANGGMLDDDRPRPKYTLATYYSNYTCALDVNYCVYGHFLELNGIFPSIQLVTIPFFCKSWNAENQTELRNFAQFKITGKLHWSNSYRPAVTIFHNCSSDNWILENTVELSEVWAFNRYHTDRFQIELKDTGDWKRTTLDSTKIKHPHVETINAWIRRKPLEGMVEEMSYFHDKDGLRLPR